MRATRFFSEKGLEQEWHAERLWLNPPSSKASGNKTADWVNKLGFEYSEGRCNSAIILLFRVAPETAMFQGLLACQVPICFPKKRIKFQAAPGYVPEGTKPRPTHGNALVGIGVDGLQFHRAFMSLGECINV